MVQQNLNIEMGKLMASVVNLQTEVCDIKNELHTLSKYVLSVHDELMNFIGRVQTKSVCERVHDQIKKDYVARSELAPVKTILGAISVTTATAICVALLNLIFK
ncbi:MAG: hypothetical protein II942_04055 [Alphaproteobacteria bacterium]|nr:hypothetical protein [Alphaproteobacteria bacterium]